MCVLCVSMCLEKEDIPIDDDRGIIRPVGGRVFGINIAFDRPLP